MKLVKKKKEIRLLEQYISLWQIIADKDLLECFQRFFSKKNGIHNQWQRVSAIRFGKIHKKFRELVEGDNTVWLRMAIVPFNDKGEVLSKDCIEHDGWVNFSNPRVNYSFTIIITVEENDLKKKHYFVSDKIKNLVNESEFPLCPGLNYGPSQSPQLTGDRNDVDLIGLRPVVKNHLCMSWCMADSYKIPALFNAVMPGKGGINEAQLIFKDAHAAALDRKSYDSIFKSVQRSFNNPFNRGIVRTHRYLVNGYNLEALKATLSDKQGRKEFFLTINLGIDNSDDFFNRSQFSLITEVIVKGETLRARVLEKFDDFVNDGKSNYIFDCDGRKLFGPGLLFNDDSQDFWISNDIIQGVMTVNNTISQSYVSDIKLEETNEQQSPNFSFTTYESVFDDYVGGCPPVC